MLVTGYWILAHLVKKIIQDRINIPVGMTNELLRVRCFVLKLFAALRIPCDFARHKQRSTLINVLP